MDEIGHREGVAVGMGIGIGLCGGECFQGEGKYSKSSRRSSC